MGRGWVVAPHWLAPVFLCVIPLLCRAFLPSFVRVPELLEAQLREVSMRWQRAEETLAAAAGAPTGPPPRRRSASGETPDDTQQRYPGDANPPHGYVSGSDWEAAKRQSRSGRHESHDEPLATRTHA